jgi:FkbM family methyltransferase|tara:strand:+ start:95 stop:406 length:312 start_codon:yes stop_codon:yes gene_type:complete
LGYAVHPIDENFESYQVALYKSLAMTNVFDVGANVGKVAERYRNLFPSSNLTLIEPIPEFAESLRQNFAGAKAVQAPLSDKNGTAEFNLAFGSGLLKATKGVP